MKKCNYLLFCFGYVFLMSCEPDYGEYIKANANSMIQVQVDTISVDADGKSYITIIAILPDTVDKRDVRFKTSTGVFDVTGTNIADVPAHYRNDSLISIVQLYPWLIENNNVKVEAQSGEFISYIDLEFNRAYPDFIVLESKIDTMKRGYASELPITVYLGKKFGKVSLSQNVSFQSYGSNHEVIGEFKYVSRNGCDSTGIVNGVFELRDTAYTGIVQILAFAKGKYNELSDTLDILVTK